MTKQQDPGPKPDHDQTDNVDNKLDSLLPAPGTSSGDTPKHERMDGDIDSLLRAPGAPDHSTDDATTREEMEVDTTADGVDDFIPLENKSQAEGPGDPKAEPELTPADTADTNTFSTICPFCDHKTHGARFCAACGMEQVATSRFMVQMAPLFMWSRPLAIRVTLTIGALLTLLALLGDSGATALIVAASTLPVVLLIRLASELGGLSRNLWAQAGAMVLVGIAAGLPISWLATRMVKRSWFEGGVLNFGATNFGGVAVETAGSAPWLIWLTNGLLLPLAMILVISAAPAALRMALDMPAQESTGTILTASVAAGYVISSAIVHYWSLYAELPPVMPTSKWTLTILGIAVIRPLVWVFFGALIGAFVWRYMRTSSLSQVAVPGTIAVALPLVFSLASLAVAPTGLWIATLVGIAFAAAAVFLHSYLLPGVLEEAD